MMALVHPLVHSSANASIAPFLCKLFNLSIQSCKIPTEWKLDNIVPVPKAKVFNEASNYRPISLLSVVSKILEKYISSLILGHLSANCPLSTIQWGFLPARSMGTALASTLFTWFQQLENKREVLAVFFDLKKAFDTVPHLPLLNRLQNTGLHPCILAWLGDYLLHRSQQVVVGNAISSPLSITSGVSQGSVLGTLLFLICITEVTLSRESKLVLFADDMPLSKPVIYSSDFLTSNQTLTRYTPGPHRTSLPFMHANVSTCCFPGNVPVCYHNYVSLNHQLGSNELERVSCSN